MRPSGTNCGVPGETDINSKQTDRKPQAWLGVCVSFCLCVFVFVFVCLCVYLSFCKYSVVAMGIENAYAYAGEEPFLILPSRLFLSPFFSPSPSYMVSSYL